jgi:hypothetical protein
MMRLTTFGMCGDTVSGNRKAVQSDLDGYSHAEARVAVDQEAPIDPFARND